MSITYGEVLIHEADPQSRSVYSAHVVRPSVPTFQNLAKQNKFHMKTLFTNGETVYLAEWIIDGTCLVTCIFTKGELYEPKKKFTRKMMQNEINKIRWNSIYCMTLVKYERSNMSLKEAEFD